MKNTEIDKVQFIEFIIDFLLDFSPKGRVRILKDLKRIKSQILCTSEKLSSVSKIGSPLVKHILNKIGESENYIDIGIEWNRTEGVKFDINEDRKAVKLIFLKLEEIYSQKGEEMIKLFLSQLCPQNDTLIRKLSVLKYRSKSPGTRLVGKQTVNNNNKNIGFVYEHTIPIKYFILEVISLLKTKKINEKIDNIFNKLISVELNTDDDQLVVAKGLKEKMPNDWNWDKDPLERYWISGVKINSLNKIS
jgi:hypothetical protein